MEWRQGSYSLLCCSGNNLPAAPHSVLTGACPKPKAPAGLASSAALLNSLLSSGLGEKGRELLQPQEKLSTKGDLCLSPLRKRKQRRWTDSERTRRTGDLLVQGEQRKVALPQWEPPEQNQGGGAPQAVSCQHGDETGIEKHLAARSEKGPCGVWAPEARTWAGAVRGSDFSGKLPSTGEEGTGSNTPGTTWSKACFSPSSSNICFLWPSPSK